MTGLTRQDFERTWELFDAEAQAVKLSQEALLRLIDYYRHLDQEDREAVDRALAEWVVGDDARRRFDALALIQEFQIRSALPGIRARLTALDGVVGPSVPTDRAKLVRIIADLE